MLLIPTLLCPKSWEHMSGTEAERFCTHCKKSVHNLEALSVSERLALLNSPAASICSRYKVAIRRPARGRKEAYLRHLIKYGATVALTGSVLLVLWEIDAQGDSNRIYRTVAATGHPAAGPDMPQELFEENQAQFVGMVAVPKPSECHLGSNQGNPVAPMDTRHIDLRLDPREIDRAIIQFKLSPPPLPKIQIPLQLDKAGVDRPQ